MKFSVSSTVLYKHLQDISRVISSKPAIPALECFLFEVKGNQLTLTASNTDTTMTTSFELISSEKDGMFAVNAKLIQDALRMLPEQPMTFNVDESSFEITAVYQNGHYTMLGISGEEFPRPKSIDGEATQLTLDAKLIFEGLNRALFATASDELRPVMTGVYFDITEDSLTLVSSDGHRLVRDRFETGTTVEAQSFILPKEPAAALHNVLSKTDGDVKITFNQNNTSFEIEGYTMITRLIEGRYPNYNSVIPKDNPNEVTVNRQELLNALKRMMVFASQSSRLIKMSLNAGEITLVAQDVEFSTSAEEKMTCIYDGAPLSIGFQGNYLIDVLSNLQGDEVDVKLADPSRPGLFMPTIQPEKENVLMLLMPMMLND